MGLEAATYINGLLASNPIGATDDRSTADDHLRLIKAVLKNTFPSLTGAVTGTETQLNNMVTYGLTNNTAASISVTLVFTAAPRLRESGGNTYALGPTFGGNFEASGTANGTLAPQWSCTKGAQGRYVVTPSNNLSLTGRAAMSITPKPGSLGTGLYRMVHIVTSIDTGTSGWTFDIGDQSGSAVDSAFSFVCATW